MKPPAGLYYSERKLWDECPDAHDVIARLARYRDALKILLEESVPASEYADLLRSHTRAIWALSGEVEYPEDERTAVGEHAQAVLAMSRPGALDG